MGRRASVALKSISNILQEVDERHLSDEAAMAFISGIVDGYENAKKVGRQRKSKGKKQKAQEEE